LTVVYTETGTVHDNKVRIYIYIYLYLFIVNSTVGNREQSVWGVKAEVGQLYSEEKI